MAFRLLVRVSCFAFLVGAMWAAPTHPANARKPQEGVSAVSVEELARRLRPSVVVVSHFGRDGKQEGIGAGVIISSNGLVATSLHVIGEARPVNIRLANGRDYDATEVHAWDRTLDLAIVRIDAPDLRPLDLGDSDQLSQGSPVVAMGNPLGMEHSIVQGVVSARRDFDGIEMIQLAIPIEPGNSGGPLVDMQGRLHGLLTLKSALTANLGFAIPVNALKKLIVKPNPVPMSRWLTIGALNTKEWLPLMGARWSQRSGRIAVEGAGSGFGGRSICLSQRPVPRRPYEVAVNVRLDDESGAAGLIFEADGEDAHYGFYPTGGQLRLTRFEGPSVFSWTILTTTNSPHYRPGDWNRLRVRVEKERLRCFINEQLVIESADTNLESGKAGLAKFRNTQAEFRDFRVGTDLSIPALAPPTVVNELRKLLDPSRQDDAALNKKLEENADVAYRAFTDEARALDRRAAQLRQIAARARQSAVQNELLRLLKRDQETDLFHAALLISKFDNPELDVETYRRQFNIMTQEIKTTLPADAKNDTRLEKLVRYLFSENGFHGSRTDYYHRANSYIDRVLDDREGLPITLSILFIELARRIGLEDVTGAPLPTRFMVMYNPGRGKERLIDVFDNGRILTVAEAEELIARESGASVEADHFTPATNRDILIRMLRNLANVAERNQLPKESLRYFDLIVALAPDAPLERLGRAMARLAAGETSGARDDLRFVIESEPPGVDLRRITELYRNLESRGE